MGKINRKFVLTPTCNESGGYTTRCLSVKPKPWRASGRWMTMVRGADACAAGGAGAAVGGGSASGACANGWGWKQKNIQVRKSCQLVKEKV